MVDYLLFLLLSPSLDLYKMFISRVVTFFSFGKVTVYYHMIIDFRWCTIDLYLDLRLLLLLAYCVGILVV